MLTENFSKAIELYQSRWYERFKNSCMDKNILIPILRDKYIPDITKRLFEKIIKSKRKNCTYRF